MKAFIFPGHYWFDFPLFVCAVPVNTRRRKALFESLRVVF